MYVDSGSDLLCVLPGTIFLRKEETNKNAFQSKAKWPLVNSTGFIVNKYEHVWGPCTSWTSLNLSGSTMVKGAGARTLCKVPPPHPPTVKRMTVWGLAQVGSRARALCGDPCEQNDWETSRHNWKHYLRHFIDNYHWLIIFCSVLFHWYTYVPLVAVNRLIEAHGQFSLVYPCKNLQCDEVECLVPDHVRLWVDARTVISVQKTIRVSYRRVEDFQGTFILYFMAFHWK